MKFVINNNVKYHEDKSELEILHDDAAPVVLTGTLNRLLSTLVRNNNVILSRDVLLTQVWEEHGQVASGNNLNNSISMLRKIFSSLGEEEIIVTLPRQGFMFTAAALNTADSLPAEPEALPEQIELVVETPPRLKRIPKLKKALLLVVALLAAAAAIFAWRSTAYTLANYQHIGTVGQCDIRLVTTHHQTDHREVNLAQVQAFLTASGIQCLQPAMVYYYSSRALVPNASDVNTVTTVSYCPKLKLASEKQQCENIYENTHS
ncbi:winged helix-turn-helix domain-containing protein [Serratia entomophila]|uniref:winged helix-turn-helix domain-containing protein n=1 Tax=Serratia entomophila TaxID=42906 RepID=UPI00217A44D7|nr:helix-turn-helix domain-containing protein [Serratia entomophila]CAI0926709.1 Transcriptional regulatory protein, C terminal [Serratia entomophila]CAI1542272.1 Transcriptional regulatory protein, C terminal [Serratia entomophila]CAI1664007.1 Transcriptional regulatory protein, C terminal [Serratia entomophila]CAI1745356.1 Transcriptional regulatory protein, C terminal [Serratia entomophila]CAI1776344.1 Transcriptional regulatory protein, C terminal [Serratia entomophila]